MIALREPPEPCGRLSVERADREQHATPNVELAPNVDASVAIASIPASCAGQCTFARDHFVLDEQGGIRFVPTDYCSVECGSDQAPRIPFEERKSKHPWVLKLDDWIRKRLEAGQSLVK